MTNPNNKEREETTGMEASHVATIRVSDLIKEERERIIKLVESMPTEEWIDVITSEKMVAIRKDTLISKLRDL